MAELTIGIVQHACSEDVTENLEKTMTGIRETAANGAQLVVLQELHRSLYFCQQEDTTIFDLAETIPGPTTDRLGALARELGVVIVASLFERRAPGLYHNTAVVLDNDGSPMTPVTMKNSISPPAIWASIRFRRHLANWAYWFAGTNGFRKPPG
jgi:N-carbamoylputrescine amidase